MGVGKAVYSKSVAGEFSDGVEGWVYVEKTGDVVYKPMEWGVCVCEPEREMVAICMAGYTIASVGSPPLWVRMPPKIARQMAEVLLESAKEVEDAMSALLSSE